MKKLPIMTVYNVWVSWVSDGMPVINHHGAYTTLVRAKEVEATLPQEYSKDYGEGYWDDNDLSSEVVELRVYV